MGVARPTWSRPTAAERTATILPARVGGWRAARRSPAVWAFRLVLLTPFVLMGPEILAALAGRPGSVTNLSASTADVLGTSAFLLFMIMLTVTPVHTFAGWRWHLVLRRDCGMAMFAVAALDLLLAATTTGRTFPGGFVARLTGHTFLAAGTLAVFLAVPLAVTANRRAQRWLGPHWKWLHRLTYFAWVAILLHLLLLFGFRSFFLDAVVISLPLAALRVPFVRRWVVSSRRMGRHALARHAIAAAAAVTLAIGYAPFLRELARVGTAAFLRHPALD